MKPKLFDPDIALEKIADVFAKHGYEGTSLDTLIKETGIGKQSLYNTFGDKKEMVKKSLQCFGKGSKMSCVLTDSELSGRERIDGFFTQLLKDAQDKKYAGCLITNLLLEKGGTDKEVLTAASERWHMTKEGFKSALEAGKADGSIRSDVDSELTAIALMSFLNGLHVTVKASGDFVKLKKVTKMILELVL